MRKSEPAAGFRDSAIAAAWGRRENHVAAIVSLVVGLAVAGASRVPLEPDFSLDLTVEPVYAFTRLATFVGFGEVSVAGRALAREARIVMNRPLPRRFTFAADGSADRPLEIEVRIGDSVQPLRFGTNATSPRVRFENPDGVREIRFGVPPDAQIRIARIDIGEADP